MSDSLYLALDNPPRALKHGANLQRWRLKVRKSGVGGDPTIRATLYESGREVLTVISETVVSGETILEGTWDARLLNSRGEDAEANLVALRGSGGASVDIASLEWTAVMLLEETTPVSDELIARWSDLTSIGDALRVLWDLDSYIAPPVSRTFEVMLPERVLLTSSRERLTVGPRAPDVKISTSSRIFR